MGIELKSVADVVEDEDDIDGLHIEAQGVVLEFVEVHELVYEAEHPLYAALCDFEQTFVLGVKVLAGGELSYGACNHRQRGAELMGDVGEETHVHLVGALFLFLLHLGFPGGALGGHDAAGIAVEVGCQQCRQREIDEPSPPGVCR